MTAVRPGRLDPQLRVDRILRRIDADRPHVAPRVVLAFAGTLRPDRARAVHALDRLDMPPVIGPEQSPTIIPPTEPNKRLEPSNPKPT